MQALQQVAAKQEAVVGRLTLPDMLQRSFLEAALGSAANDMVKADGATSGGSSDDGTTAPMARGAVPSPQTSRVVPSPTPKEAGGAEGSIS